MLSAGDPNVLLALAREQASAGQYEPAAATLEEALRLAPRAWFLWHKLGTARYELGLVDEALDAWRQAVQCAPHEPLPRQGLLHASVMRAESPAAVFQAHRAWAALVETQAVSLASRCSGRLRVGYVSGDFAAHAIALFVEPVLAGHDREALEVYCYDNRERGDAVTERLMAYRVNWRRIAALGDAELARAIRADGVDVLVDLSGHTARNRLGAFALRCAPVQVTWLGHPASSGLAAMDWRLSDAHCDPPGSSEAYYTERLWRLPDCLWCYRPALESVAARWQPRARITFGSLNNGRKISPRGLQAWLEVLRAVGDSRLVIAGLADGPRKRQILAQAAACGIDAGRIECRAWMSARQFAALHAEIDIALDSYPFAGGTTSIEALWHGVPLVSLAGETAASRSGASILANVGLADLVATDAGRYVDIAAGLAGDRARLAALHAELPARLQGSPIMDERRFVAGLEQAYRAMSH